MIQRLIDFLTSRRMTVAEESMLPTLQPGDRVVFSVRAYRKAAPERGDIVLLRAPGSEARLDVKRIVGLPREVVRVVGGVASINGRRLEETYLASDPPSGRESAHEWTLDGTSYVILGDNRSGRGAVDSRSYGPVRRELIVGKLGRRF